MEISESLRRARKSEAFKTYGFQLNPEGFPCKAYVFKLKTKGIPYTTFGFQWIFKGIPCTTNGFQLKTK